MRLLIVDDSALLQERLRTAIVRINRQVEIMPAYNCAEARELFGAGHPDTAILDISLPDGNGMNLLEEFRSQSPTLRILMMTNNSNIQIKRSCFEKGADDFFDKMDLLKLVERFRSEPNEL